MTSLVDVRSLPEISLEAFTCRVDVFADWHRSLQSVHLQSVAWVWRSDASSLLRGKVLTVTASSGSITSTSHRAFSIGDELSFQWVIADETLGALQEAGVSRYLLSSRANSRILARCTCRIGLLPMPGTFRQSWYCPLRLVAPRLAC